jgi:hypothetical protein
LSPGIISSFGADLLGTGHLSGLAPILSDERSWEIWLRARSAEINSKAIDLNGTDEYCSKANPVGLDLNGSERITATTDRDFETSVGNWAGAGNHAIVQSADYKKAGTYSGKITAGGAGDATTNYVQLPSSAFTTLVVGEKYTYEFWAYGNTVGVTLAIAIGDKVVTGKAIYNAVAGTFSKVVFNFQATASTVGQPIRLYLSGAGLCYVDVNSLTQAWDALLLIWCKADASSYNAMFFWLGMAASTRLSVMGTNNSNVFRMQLHDGTNLFNIMTGSLIKDSNWHFCVVAINRTDQMTAYVDGALATSPNFIDIRAFGKCWCGTAGPLQFGKQGEYPIVSGVLNIGENSLILFTSLPSDIAAFIADCNANGIPPKEVVEEQYAANGAAVKAHYQFKGDTDAEMLADISGTGNNLTGNNVTQADDQVDGDYRSLNGTYLIGRDDATKIVLIPGDTPTSPFRIRADMECPISNAISISSTTATCADWHLIGMKFSLLDDKKIYLYLDGSEVAYSDQTAGV